ncbi:hypothetical protein EIN_475910 [Entamoeba invadens IP1]|uniref:Uncharacterized protein n=1 Tax=Entamoeba invadens IP1 TaxID=370355 RepID=A0A0A1U3T7_ENTIV|nr:hypothetical protein EIN_475910 [Entamoeba invadens IP1]ELP88889.1 hypothetical protein EIN_475910 [Entamoeba invadens IP1]|eukprot:XP_004255660.1 hypothetical protein EIN_475910 [Entamoeba invadens IP1]
MSDGRKEYVAHREEILLSINKLELTLLQEGMSYLDIITIYHNTNALEFTNHKPTPRYPTHQKMTLLESAPILLQLKLEREKEQQCLDKATTEIILARATTETAKKGIKLTPLAYEEIVKVLSQSKEVFHWVKKKANYVVRVEEYEFLNYFCDKNNTPSHSIKKVRKIARTTMRTYFDIIRSSGKNYWIIGESPAKYGSVKYCKATPKIV